MTDPVFKPSGVVTLLTDFGLSDPYVGVMKGVMLSLAPKLELIDLTHGVPAQAVAVGAWHLSQSWSRFPKGTVHVVVVDPGVGSDRRILLAERDGHIFLGPDNGVLDPSLDGDAVVRSLDIERFALPGASRTFHGRDVFSPAAAALASGLDPSEAGELVSSWERFSLPEAEVDEAGVIHTEALYADSFGNLITTVEAALLGEGEWTVELCGESMPLVGTYAEVEIGALLALVGSSGTVEVSQRDGDAAASLGAGAGASVVIRPSASD